MWLFEHLHYEDINVQSTCFLKQKECQVIKNVCIQFWLLAPQIDCFVWATKKLLQIPSWTQLSLKLPFLEEFYFGA